MVSELRLEKFSKKYLTKEYLSWLNNKELMKYSENRHITHTLESCQKYHESFQDSHNLLFAVINDQNKHIGNINAYIDKNNAIADIGILIGKPGKGYGKKAWNLMIKTLFNQFNIRKITAGSMEKNIAMINIFKESGMSYEYTKEKYFNFEGSYVDLVGYTIYRNSEQNFSLKSKKKISLLSTLDHPLLGRWINSISKSFSIHSIIIDPQKNTEKEKQIWFERTGGKFEPQILNDLIETPPFFFMEGHNSIKTLDFITKNKIDLLVNCGTPRILGKEIISSTTFGVLNGHPGELPYYRGCTCIEWALFNGDKVGVTFHLMTEKIDEGPIIQKKFIDVRPDMSYQDIRILAYKAMIKSIPQAIKKVFSGEYSKKFPQKGRYWKPIDKKKLNEVIKNYSGEVNV